MTKRLDTLEEFERVALALQDPNAKPHQYIVRKFGFCTECSSIAEYEFHGSSEGTSTRCLGCQASEGGPLGYVKRNLILSGDMVPVRVKGEIDRLHSREEQTRFFFEEIKEREETLATQAEQLRALTRDKENFMSKLLLLKSKVQPSQTGDY